MHTSKLLLVPPEAVNSKSEENFLAALDEGMKKILEKKELPIEQKLAEYNQLLHRYLKTVDKQKEPLKIEVKESIEKNTNAFNDQEIIESIPLPNRKHAKILLAAMKKNGKILWEDSGELVADGMKIEGSNIVDLVHDFSRTCRPNNPVIGADVLARLLKNSNIPLTYIGNKHRRKLVNDDAELLLATPRNEPIAVDSSTSQSTPMPAKKSVRNRRQKNLAWNEM